MSWKEDLRAQLEKVGSGKPSQAPTLDESDAQRREVLEHAMQMAEKVFKFAVTQLPAAKYVASSDFGDEVLRLTHAKCFVELRLIVNGLAIKVHRETGVIDLLYVEKGTVVDGKHKRVSSLEGYFGGLVVDVAADSKCEPEADKACA
ncbi:MAG: hypothetical protein ACO1OB_16960 [Archangium sp.]